MVLKDSFDHVSRRTVLKATAGVGAVAGLSSLAIAQNGGGSGAIQTDTIELGGKIQGWTGESPSAIEGETNPTLTLTAGTTYTVNWESLDGVDHNFGILDSSGNDIDRTNTGQSGSLTFEATQEIAQYNCGIHPTSMLGDVEIVAAATTTEATTTQTTTEQTTTEESTTEATPTEETTTQTTTETTTEQTTTAEPTTEEATTTETTTTTTNDEANSNGKAKEGDKTGSVSGGNGKAKQGDDNGGSGEDRTTTTAG